MLEINKIYFEDCFEGMKRIDDNSIDLIITSPPYFNARPEYAEWDSYEDYLSFLNNILQSCFMKLKSIGRIAINVPDGYGRNPWIPIYADTCKLMQNIGYILRGSIVWNKQNGGGKTSWGSWRSSSNPCLIDEHEMIIIAHKENPKLKIGTEIKKDLFLSLIHSVWNIKPETKRKLGHPAPYPLELPIRIITFLSSENTIILDPFMGSGTTAIACINTNRNYIGFENNKEYFDIANKRISAHKKEPTP